MYKRQTDARAIGVTAPVRESGDVAGSAGCKLVGPKGEVELSEGVIIAKRHIHLTPADAAELEVADKDVVWVRVNTEGRSLIFGDVVCRVSEDVYKRQVQENSMGAAILSRAPYLWSPARGKPRLANCTRI